MDDEQVAQTHSLRHVDETQNSALDALRGLLENDWLPILYELSLCAPLPYELRSCAPHDAESGPLPL